MCTMELVSLLLQSFDPQNRYLCVCFSFFRASLVRKSIFYYMWKMLITAHPSAYMCTIYMDCKANGFFALRSILVGERALPFLADYYTKTINIMR